MSAQVNTTTPFERHPLKLHIRGLPLGFEEADVRKLLVDSECPDPNVVIFKKSKDKSESDIAFA
jgi:hypothetical protein